MEMIYSVKVFPSRTVVEKKYTCRLCGTIRIESFVI